MTMKIAIIGSGISGMGAAYLLNAAGHDIIVYEKNNYIGGHSRTIMVDMGGKKTPVDTGFIVFNDWNYPNLMGLFAELDVAYEESDMSFGVSIDNGWLEYGSSNMFAQRKNIIRPGFLGMITDILRFNKKALELAEHKPHITLDECINELRMGQWFRKYYILAMGAAIWSCPIETIMKFPARTFLTFFKNHGLLSVNNRPQWYTVSGGSREYVSKLTAPFKDKIKLETAVVSIKPENGKLSVTDKTGTSDIFDHIILASHADESLKMLQHFAGEYDDVLPNFTYQKNHIVVHSDTSFMPKNKNCWSSWVYLCEGREDTKPVLSVSYWMNNLQNLDHDYPIFVTLNPGREPRPETVIDKHDFTHPVFDTAAIKAQKKINSIQGKNNIWFCGAYQRYGFHEDGLMSAVNVAEKLGVNIPWK